LDEGIAQPLLPVLVESGGSGTSLIVDVLSVGAAKLHEETIGKSVASRYCSSQETVPQNMSKSRLFEAFSTTSN
jgi:hypothetical protein